MIVIDRSSWGRLRVTGSDRVRFLQGLTTVDVKDLADGAHGWGAILNPKGKMLSVVNVSHHGDGFIVTTEKSLTDKTKALFEKYAVMDDVVFEPLEGPSHQTWTDVASVWTAPIVAGDHPHAVPESEPGVEVLRIRAGFLRYNCDVDEDAFPFETPIGTFLDYEKGCYVGQETVFRVHAQGNTARMLRAFAIEGNAPVAEKAAIVHPAKANAGHITSQISGESGTTLALGYVHRTAWAPGDIVQIDGRRATIHELPYTS